MAKKGSESADDDGSCGSACGRAAMLQLTAPAKRGAGETGEPGGPSGSPRRQSLLRLRTPALHLLRSSPLPTWQPLSRPFLMDFHRHDGIAAGIDS